MLGLNRFNCTCLLFGLLGLSEGIAQYPNTELTRIEPTFARVGETINLTVHGTNLDDLSELRFTHPGISSKRVMHPIDGIFPTPRPVGNQFEVQVPADVEPGVYEVCVTGFFGISTLRPFVITSAESIELHEEGQHGVPEAAMEIPVGSTVTGAVDNRGIDWYQFDCPEQGRCLIEIVAERIDSRLDGMLVLFDSTGKELARNRQHFGRDPFLEVPSDAKGPLMLAVSDILYRGGSEHFYRLKLHTGAHIDYVFPPSGIPGKQRFTIFGRNLPREHAPNAGSQGRMVPSAPLPLESMDLEVELPKVARQRWFRPELPRQAIMPRIPIRVGLSNRKGVGISTSPIVEESSAETPQKIPFPCEIAGRFETPNDEDIFVVTLSKGDEVAIEVTADRLGSLVDPALLVHRISSDQESLIAESDDLRSFFSIHGKDSTDCDTLDAAVRFSAEEDGQYRISLINQFGNGDPSQVYQLAVRHPEADFQLIAITERPLATNRAGFPSVPHLRKGSRRGIRILAPRQDQFEGEIVVSASGLPPGVTAKPLVLSGTTDEGILVLEAKDDVEPWAGFISIEGLANVGGRTIRHEAQMATIVWGHIFADSIRVRSRLSTRIPLSVTNMEVAPVQIQPQRLNYEVHLGDSLEIPIEVVNAAHRSGNLTIEPQGLFGMLRNPPTVNISENETQGTLTISFKANGNFDAQPGTYQFVLHGTGVAKYQQNLVATECLTGEQNRLEMLLQKLEAEEQIVAMRLQELKNRQDSKPESDQQVAATTSILEELKAKRTAAENAKKQIDAEAKTAAGRSAEKNTKFAVWSTPITVQIHPQTKK